jgi:hypothetical protein
MHLASFPMNTYKWFSLFSFLYFYSYSNVIKCPLCYPEEIPIKGVYRQREQPMYDLKTCSQNPKEKDKTIYI